MGAEWAIIRKVFVDHAQWSTKLLNYSLDLPALELKDYRHERENRLGKWGHVRANAPKSHLLQPENHGS